MEAVAGLLLAAGGGRRVGAPKALLRHGDQLLVERAAGVLRDAGCAPIIVVLGAGAERVRVEADLAGTTIVVNPEWESGLGGSLCAGLAVLAETPAEAAVVLLVDTPGVTAEAVRRVAALPYPQALVCATYGGQRGHPVLLGRAHWPGVAALAKADVGARPYLSARAGEVLEVGCDGVGTDADIDTPANAAALGITVPAVLSPVAVGPEPVMAGPEPVAVGPEPVMAGPEPVAVGPEPVMAGPAPVVVGSAPVADGDTDGRHLTAAPAPAR